MTYKLGSLFDGSGGFPLAGSLCGIEPRWASEVELYPIAVTRERFPNMKHLGDISKINGAEIEPVDIITFGSPCQDLSVAGKRAGLKHEANGDEETTRSGLFMEAVRIIKEMRTATNGKYPRFALWENVPGAFSSNKGEDFRIVCEELIKIVEPSALMPEVPKNGWPYSDSYIGDGWSLAYRVFDAQYWGVPQRRRRIHLVADFRGERAREVLFERDGVRGYFTKSGTPWQTAAADTEGSAGATDREGEISANYGVTTKGNGDAFISKERHTSLTAGGRQAGQGYPCVLTIEDFSRAAYELYKREFFNDTDRAEQSPVCFDEFFNNEWQEDEIREEYIRKLTAIVPYTLKIRSGCECGGKGALIQEDKRATLATNNDQYLFQPIYAVDQGGGKSSCNVQEGKSPTLCTTHGGEPAVCYRQGGFAEHIEGEVGTLRASDGDFGGGSENLIATPCYCLQGSMIGRADKNGPQGDGINEDTTFTLNTADRHVVVYSGNNVTSPTNKSNPQYNDPCHTIDTDSRNWLVEKTSIYIVRRLTPTECARLQGFADLWGHIPKKTELTDEEYRFWLEARNTHAAINRKPVKEYTKAQMLTWYNKLYTDSAEYKMWGNGIALPPALYCMQGVIDALAASITENNQTIICHQIEEAVEHSEDEATDLSDAPEEIKAEIIKNDELLQENKTTKEIKEDETMETPINNIENKGTENTIPFSAVEQLRQLANERKALAKLNTENPRFTNDVRALEYAVNVLEAVGL